MREVWRVRRRSRVLAIAVALVMVASALLAFAQVSATAAAGPQSAAPAAAAGSSAVSGPLTAIAGSGTSLSTTGPTQLGTTTVLPVPSQYNANALDSVTVTLTPAHSLSTLVNEVNNPSSSMYRHFLSASTLGSEYGSGAYAGAATYFQGYGLTVTGSATQLTLTVSGTVSQIAAAFHTQLQAFQSEYQSAGAWSPSFGNASGVPQSVSYGPVFYANTAPAELPSGLSVAVNGLMGLDGMTASPNVRMPLNMYPGLTPSATGGTNTSVPMSSITCSFGVFGSCPQSLNTYQNQSISSGNFLWTNFAPYGLTCAYYGLCGQYQFLFPSTMPALLGAHNLWSGATTIQSEPDTGQGITIAVIEVGCAFPSDLAAWSQMTFGSSSQLMNRLTQIAISGHGFFPNNNLEYCELNGEFAGWTIETELDVEYAAAMAPGAHIDVIGIPYPGYFSDFNLAYGDIAQYLALGSTGGICPTTSTLNAAGIYIVAGGGAGTCSVTITSNSYGSGESYTYFYGSPMYISGEDQELELLNSVGVTNFFASGDSGGVYATVEDFTPADSTGATSVGGAQVTAESGGSEFPVTSNSFNYCDGFSFYGYCFGAFGTAFWAPASGIGGVTYWSEGPGYVGGGFGQSLTHSQPWWQNALDTYSTGSAIDPIVSGSAAFNMTIYAYGGWNLFYGGTSFACPTTAGEWALIEEQANVAFGNPMMGDVNPLLYGAHNAYQAGAGGVVANPYVPMQNLGVGFDSAPTNSFTWYYFNLSINVPSDPVVPSWFPSLGNPAGSGWNYLQGLGVPMADVLDNALLGQTGLAGHSLANPAYSILEVTSGGLVPFTTLEAGTAYTLEVIGTDGQTGVVNVAAYSGQANDGTYGGGTLTTIQTGSNGQFTYTPTSGTPPGGDAATTYGYFLVASVVGSDPAWGFAPYAVAEPTQGTLSLCVVDPYGDCQSAVGETTMFTTSFPGFYNLYGQAEVTLNGLPVAGAVVTQVAIASQYGILDPTLPPASYAPGMTIGQTISDARGGVAYWTDAFIAENNGPLYTDVYTLTATYDGLVSNTVTVFVEPQSGSFFTNDLSMNCACNAITGTLQFADMKYVNWVNVSIGSAPGQYQNVSYPSGTFDGSIAVDLSTVGLTGPIVVSEMASGANDLTLTECFFGFCFTFGAAQNPIVWQDPTVFLPTHLTATAIGTVTGTDTFSFAGTAYAGAVGKLELVSATGTQVLATGMAGSYSLNTAGLADGSYRVVYTEVNTAGAFVHTSSVSIYAANTATALAATISELQAQLTTDSSTIAALDSQLASAQAEVASLSAGWASTNATVASLNSEVSSLQGQVASLQGQVSSLQTSLATETATASSLQQDISVLEAQGSQDTALITSLKANLQSAQATIATEKANLASAETQITTLNGQVQQLQQELNARKNYVAPAWYDTSLGGGLVLLFAGLGAAIGAAGTYAVLRRQRSTGSSDRVPQPQSPQVTPFGSLDATGSGPSSRAPEDVIRRAMAARAQLLREGNVRSAARIEESARVLGELTGVPVPPTEYETLYR